MHKNELRNKISEMQLLSRIAIKELYKQNFYNGMHAINQILQILPKCLDVIMMDNTILSEEDIELLNCSLQNILNAQENQDYILLADLIEMLFLQDLNKIQIQLIENCDDLSVMNDNYEVLMEKYPEIEKKITEMNRVEEQEYIVEMTNSGRYTLASQGSGGKYYFHSNIDPMFEAHELSGWHYNPECNKYLVVGCGLWYHIEELLKLDESIYIDIFEQDINIICIAMRYRELSKLLGNSHITLHYDPDYSQLAKYILNDNQEIFIHYPSLRHISDLRVKQKMEQLFIRYNGIKNQRNLLLSNYRENMRNCKKNVDELKAVFQGKKAVIVAAGPSLNKNVAQLKKCPKDVLIISTGTAFHRLLEEGIKVDYVIVSDAQPGIRYQFRDNMNANVPVLLLSTASKCVAAEYSGESYIIFQKGFELAELAAKEQNVSCYDTGGSVATTALDVCIRLGCSKIAYIGLDLAYTGNVGHANGTSGVMNIVTDDMELIDGYEIVNNKINNIKVPTSKIFTIYRNWISNRVRGRDVAASIYDATEGGSIVEGLSIITLRDYLLM